MKKVTIEDVARAAGVGKGTVDRVIHNRGRVSPETRQRVEKCIKELNYKPNMAARMLANRKAYKIAVIFHHYAKEFWDEVEVGIDKAYMEYMQMGVTVDKFILPDIDIKKQEEFIYKAIEEDYDGLALVPYNSPEINTAIRKALDKGIKVIVFNNDENCERLCYVGQNVYKSGRTAGLLMSMVAPPNSNYFVVLAAYESMKALSRRFEGFEEVIKEKRPDLNQIGVCNCTKNEQAYEITTDLLKKQQVDVIYVTSSILSEVARAVYDAKLSDKVILIGHDLPKAYDNYLLNGTVNISVNQEAEKQGYVIIDKLCKHLLLNQDTFEDYYTNIEIVVAENMTSV